jgi:hypothetical protein
MKTSVSQSFSVPDITLYSQSWLLLGVYIAGKRNAEPFRRIKQDVNKTWLVYVLTKPALRLPLSYTIPASPTSFQDLWVRHQADMTQSTYSDLHRRCGCSGWFGRLP